MKKKTELCHFVSQIVEQSCPNVRFDEYRTLLEISIYQDLRRYRSVPNSDSRELQILLLEAFEQQYPTIAETRAVPLFDLGLCVQEWVAAETGNHSFGFERDGVTVYDEVGCDKAMKDSDSFGVDHWLYRSLPRGEREIANTNRAKELKRVAIDHLAPLLNQLDRDSVCDQALFQVIVSEVLTIKSNRVDDLSAYLYGASHALLTEGLSKHESLACAAELSQALEQVNGFPPEPMWTIWRFGFSHSKALIERYDQLMESLDEQEDSVLPHHGDEGVKVEVWRYPDKAQTLRVYGLDEVGNCWLEGPDGDIT